jgi:hypothetical protein
VGKALNMLNGYEFRIAVKLDTLNRCRSKTNA